MVSPIVLVWPQISTLLSTACVLSHFQLQCLDPSDQAQEHLVSSLIHLIHFFATGIVSIMTKATARLEGQQQDKYSGQENYDKWVKKVKSPLFPFL